MSGKRVGLNAVEFIAETEHVTLHEHQMFLGFYDVWSENSLEIPFKRCEKV